jgi:hypothetical protein
VTRELGRFRLKGFEQAVEVHELVGWPGEAAQSQPWRDTFAAALQHYRQRSWQAAETALRRTLELRPGDGPARFYLARLAEVGSQDLPADWTGESELKEK